LTTNGAEHYGASGPPLLRGPLDLPRPPPIPETSMSLPRRILLTILPLVLATAAAAQRAPAPDGASGPPPAAAESFVLRSAILNEERRIHVALPPSHVNTSRRYPVVIVLDGESLFAPARTAAEWLASVGHVPEAIVVGIENTDRLRDLTPPGLSVSGSSLNEGGDRFLDFIERELLPAMDERYRGGAPRVFVGHSSGGILTTYAAATRSAAFPLNISIDAPVFLSDSWLAARLTERARSGGPELVRYVSLESRFGWTQATWDALKAAAPPSWRLHRERLAGESHNSMTMLALYLGLRDIFTDYSVVNAPAAPSAPAARTAEHYRMLEQAFGAPLPPPETVLRRLFEDLLTEGSVEPARRVLAWLTDGYGRQPDQGTLEAQLAHAQSLPPLAETVESLRATPMPGADEIAPYVGEWRGHTWMNPAAKNPLGLRITVVDGRVAAEILREGREPGDAEVAVPVDYLKVVSGGLHFGQMNGMRPRGMIVNEGRRTGEVLEGEQGFRGIRLPLPDGHVPPVIHFRLIRVPPAPAAP
jgi:uncharacterized protein